MKRCVLIRIQALPDRTLGWLHVYDGVVEQGRFAVLELPDRGNRRNISRIPAGRYRMIPEYDPQKYRDHYRIPGVEGRDGILLHRGNYPSHTRGCMLIGLRFADLDADGLFDVSQSDAAMRLLSSLVREEATLHVFDADT